MVLKINDNDVSNRIIAGSYNVNSADEYQSWVDANGLTHRQFIRSRIKGSFDMLFKDQTEYNAFLSVLASAKRTDLSYKITLNVNNTNEFVTKWFFLNFESVRNRNYKWDDYFERFTVNIEER